MSDELTYERLYPNWLQSGIIRTTHLILAIVLGPDTSDAKGGRGLGSDSINPFKARGYGREILIIDDNRSRATSKRVSNRHFVGKKNRGRPRYPGG